MKHRLAVVIVIVIVTGAVAVMPGVAGAQLVSQSELTAASVDPGFQLTLEHLAMESRWLGVSPREITWSPDGQWIYFRWREDPAPGQLPETDPWYATNRAGTEVRQVPEAEAVEIPTTSIRWSGGRDLAAWARQGTLFVWTERGGTRPVYTSAGRLGNLSVAWDGSAVFFATRGVSRAGEDQGDLWAYEVASGHARQVARGVDEDDEDADLTDGAKWIKAEELDLLEIVRKRKDDREHRELLSREREPFRPQEIPIEDGARAISLALSPDGRHVSFMWRKDPTAKHRTRFMEFVNEQGYATEKEARPKVGDPLPEYKMGIVAVDPSVARKDIEVTWVDAGVEKDTVIHGPYWNPRGTHAALQILSIDHKDRWISLVDIETGETTVIDHQHEDAWIGGPLVGGRWNPGLLEWLPDGQAFGFASTATGWSMLYLATVDGDVRPLTNGDWEVRRAELSADGATWLLTTSQPHPGEEQFYHLPARGGDLVRITGGEGKHLAAVSPDGGRLAVRSESPTLMPDLFVSENAAGADMVRITKSGSDDFYRHAWIDSEIISFPDGEGHETWARVWETPARPNGAAVVFAHGCGECAQGVDKGWGTRFGATLYANYIHQQGYTSASIDYRGSSGYGHANRTYAYRQMGVSDIDSGLPLLDILSDRYGVDRERIGVYGGSYGGFFTIMSLLRNPGAYAAGVALYPVTDWAHYNQGYTSRILNGTPQDDPEAYRRSSPVYYANNLQDPLQIQHGLVDNNVQIQDSFRLSQIFLEHKKVYDLVVYPMEDHGWDEVPTKRDSYRRMTEWFDRYLLDDARVSDAQNGNGSR